MASCLENQDLAMATGWFFLVSSLGTVSSVTVTNVMLQSSFRRNLERVIEDPDKDNLIEKITSSINNIANLSGELRLTVVDAFVGSLKTGYISGFVACILSSCFAAFLRANIVGEHLE
ncbi:hypothetical protein EDB80DRAFT_890238 [Ilyonectria destructans]|nr:hypothetical protein EDB80DRAFT_890238 [Ilyonectria destructans]